MKKPNALPTVLFDHTSIGPHSAVFDIPSQVTITAFGLQPDDYITFEALQLTPGARAFACGCVLTPAQEALIADTQQLQCPSCDSDVLRPVRMTDARVTAPHSTDPVSAVSTAALTGGATSTPSISTREGGAMAPRWNRTPASSRSVRPSSRPT